MDNVNKDFKIGNPKKRLSRRLLNPIAYVGLAIAMVAGITASYFANNLVFQVGLSVSR